MKFENLKYSKSYLIWKETWDKARAVRNARLLLHTTRAVTKKRTLKRPFQPKISISPIAIYYSAVPFQLPSTPMQNGTHQ